MSKNKHDEPSGDSDIIIEEEFNEDSGVGHSYQKKIDTLQKNLKKCQSEKTEYLDGWQRAQAEFVNYKKNNANIFEHAKDASIQEIVESLLPVLDSFDMALSGTYDDSFKKWLTGFEYVHTQLKKILEQYDVTEMNPMGEEFCPEFHEASEEVETLKQDDDGKIAQVVLKGYQTPKRIIRAPQVKVYKCVKKI